MSSEVTILLAAARSGDGQAGEKLLALVYSELRRLAAAKMAREQPGHTLQATALVLVVRASRGGARHLGAHGEPGLGVCAGLAESGGF